MAEEIPSIPYNTPLLNRNGFLNEPWARWFQMMFRRVGGKQASSNTAIDSKVDALSDQVSENRAAIEGLSVGRQL